MPITIDYWTSLVQNLLDALLINDANKLRSPQNSTGIYHSPIYRPEPVPGSYG